MLPRQGDITLGNFKDVSKYDKNFVDGKRTSLILVNRSKGIPIYDVIRHHLKLNKNIPLDFVTKQSLILTPAKVNGTERKRFFEIVKDESFKKAQYYIKNDKYDVGIIGVWTGLNYGSVLTYYALQKIIKKIWA